MQNKICSHDQDRRPVLRAQFFYNTSAYFPSKLPFFFLHKNHLTEKDYYTQELTCCYQES